MGSLMEMTANIVSSHASLTAMPGDELIRELQKVYLSLQMLDEGVSGEATGSAGTAPAMTLKQAFRRDQVSCMVCGKSGMKTLARHLRMTHNLKPGAYRRRFGIPSSQPLTAGDFSAARKKMAAARPMGDLLAKARAVRASNSLARKGASQA